MLTVTIPDDGLEQRISDLQHEYRDNLELVPWEMEQMLPADVASRVDVVVIGNYWGRHNWNLLHELPNLKAVLLPSAGFEHALPHIPAGVTLCNGRGVHSAGTSELALGLILASQRGFIHAFEAQRAGRWSNPELSSLADRRVLVVGAGSLAQAIIARLQPFEVEITVVGKSAQTLADGRRVHPVSELPSLLLDADIVVLAVPLDDSTLHLMDAQALALLPDGALLVNVARGKVVDTEALLAELQAGRLRAALDVTDPEPLPADHPLWHAPNTIITAHQGGHSDATYPRVAALVRRQLLHMLHGEPLENVITGPSLVRDTGIEPVTSSV